MIKTDDKDTHGSSRSIADEYIRYAEDMWKKLGFVNDRLNQVPFLAFLLQQRDQANHMHGSGQWRFDWVSNDLWGEVHQQLRKSRFETQTQCVPQKQTQPRSAFRRILDAIFHPSFRLRGASKASPLPGERVLDKDTGRTYICGAGGGHVSAEGGVTEYNTQQRAEMDIEEYRGMVSEELDAVFKTAFKISPKWRDIVLNERGGLALMRHLRDHGFTISKIDGVSSTYRLGDKIVGYVQTSGGGRRYVYSL